MAEVAGPPCLSLLTPCRPMSRKMNQLRLLPRSVQHQLSRFALPLVHRLLPEARPRRAALQLALQHRDAQVKTLLQRRQALALATHTGTTRRFDPRSPRSYPSSLSPSTIPCPPNLSLRVRPLTPVLSALSVLTGMIRLSRLQSAPCLPRSLSRTTTTCLPT